MSTTQFINGIIYNPAFHDYLAIVKGARNGFVYGLKVRFPHALVMSVLFGRGEYVIPPLRIPYNGIYRSGDFSIVGNNALLSYTGPLDSTR